MEKIGAHALRLRLTENSNLALKLAREAVELAVFADSSLTTITFVITAACIITTTKTQCPLSQGDSASDRQPRAKKGQFLDVAKMLTLQLVSLPAFSSCNYGPELCKCRSLFGFGDKVIGE